MKALSGEDTQRKVWRMLQYRIGKDRALTSKELAIYTATSERKIRDAIQQLRLEGKPIASLVHPPYGYFIPANREEAEECLRHIYSRVREIARMARPLQAAFDLEVPPEDAKMVQMALLEEDVRNAAS